MNKGEWKAKEKAVEYREDQSKPAHSPTGPNPADAETESQPATPAPPRSESGWNDLISHRIEEALRNGAFDNLPNKGKPLPLERNPYVPEDQQMANDLLKSNNLAPHWISERTATLALIDRFRLRLRTTSERFQQAWLGATHEQARLLLQESWQQQLEDWAKEIKELNRRITTVNLQQPIARLEIFKVLLDEELKRVGMGRMLMEKGG